MFCGTNREFVFIVLITILIIMLFPGIGDDFTTS